MSSKKPIYLYSLSFFFCMLWALDSFAQGKARPGTPVGRGAAAKYFPAPSPEKSASAGDDFRNVLWLHLGRATGSQAYKWSEKGRLDGVATSSYGLSYFLGDWGSLDGILRADFNQYEFTDNRLLKLSLMPLVVLPQLSTRFPLYFGMGAGLGVFFKQLESKSQISLDYQLFMGLRLMDLWPGLGFFIEYGLKNHVHVLSEGQLNSTVLTLGPIFHF
ncbi:MAG: hypothetical protein WCH11_02235 [Bdellovibrio sp.]